MEGGENKIKHRRNKARLKELKTEEEGANQNNQNKIRNRSICAHTHIYPSGGSPRDVEVGHTA